MDYRGIAEVMRMPVSTVGIRLQRGKKMLRKIVEDQQRKQ
jgi:DNA-directed RNA polymerase specialized sigma24 family protein